MEEIPLLLHFALAPPQGERQESWGGGAGEEVVEKSSLNRRRGVQGGIEMYCVRVKSKTLSKREKKNGEDRRWSEEGARFCAYLT